MRLEHYEPDVLKKQILAIVGMHLDLNRYRVFFFGSRVIGRGDDRSDIDVGIEGPEPIPFHIMAGIRAQADALPTLYKVDVVDFARVSPRFRDVALQHTEVIHG